MMFIDLFTISVRLLKIYVKFISINFILLIKGLTWHPDEAKGYRDRSSLSRGNSHSLNGKESGSGAKISHFVF